MSTVQPPISADNIAAPPLAAAGFIAIGCLCITLSRWVADNFRSDGSDGFPKGLALWLGVGDSYFWRLYRWTTMVVVGLSFIGYGVLSVIW